MTRDKTTKCFEVDGYEVALYHDEIGGESEMEITHPDGVVCAYPVPWLDKGGCPAMHGDYVSMRDLERLALLHVKYAVPTSDLGVDGRFRLAAEMGAPLNDDSPSFAWYHLMEKAEKLGVSIDAPESNDRPMTLH